MIINLFLDGCFNFIRSIFGTVDFDVSVMDQFLDKIFEIIRVACYLLPMGTVMNIFSLSMLLLIYRIGVSLLSTIWRILPLM